VLVVNDLLQLDPYMYVCKYVCSRNSTPPLCCMQIVYKGHADHAVIVATFFFLPVNFFDSIEQLAPAVLCLVLYLSYLLLFASSLGHPCHVIFVYTMVSASLQKLILVDIQLDMLRPVLFVFVDEFKLRIGLAQILIRDYFTRVICCELRSLEPLS
jgi:hypothetical protein